MRKLLGLLILIGIGYFVYTNYFARKPPRFTFPEKIAWRNLMKGSDGLHAEVCLVNGNRWRIESGGTPNTLVGVFDGTRFASNLKNAATAKDTLDPRTELRRLIETVANREPEATETRDGHACWRYSESKGGKSFRIWINPKTHFPVYAEGTLPSGPFEWRYEILSLDLDRNAGQYFNADLVAPQFLHLLKDTK